MFLKKAKVIGQLAGQCHVCADYGAKQQYPPATGHDMIVTGITALK